MSYKMQAARGAGKTRLVIVEGIPGAGKSTIAQYANDVIRGAGLATELRLEGDLSHPADFESVAWFDGLSYEQLRSAYCAFAGTLDQYACSESSFGGLLVAYGRLLADSRGRPLPAALVDELRRRDVADGTGMETYRQLTVARWARFARQAAGTDLSYIFECCLLQNPSTIMLCRHNATPDAIAEHVAGLAATVVALNPLVLYLRHQDVRQTLERVAASRPRAWLDFVIGYVTKQGYGRSRGLTGFEGMVEFYTYRQQLELSILPQLPVESKVIDITDGDWTKSRATIRDALRLQQGIAPATSNSACL